MNYNFDEMFDLDELKNDIDTADSGDREFEEVPFGTYEVGIDKLELTSSKAGNPMVSVWFKIVAGDFKKYMLFYNQVINKGFQIKIMNRFLKSLKSRQDIYFDSFKQYGELIDDIYDEIRNDEYALSYKEGKNGFHIFEIEGKF